MISKRDLMRLLDDVGDDDMIQFDGTIETGRGVTGDSDCSVTRMDPDELNEDVHSNTPYVLHIYGDESCETGYYD